MTGLGEVVTHGEYSGPELLVGSTWKKEIAPDYIVTVKVAKLKNIEGDDNGVAINPDSEKYTKIKDAGGNPGARYNSKVLAYKGDYNKYSAAEAYGLQLPGLSSISGEINTLGCNQCSGELLNVGVTYEISATYRGKPVKPAFFALSAEEASEKEAEIYKTNGKGWELLTELSGESTTQSFNANDGGWIHNNLATDMYKNAGYDPATVADKIDELSRRITNKKITAETVSVVHPGRSTMAADGLGTQVFGPVANRKNRYSTPIIVTRGATTVDTYLISAGSQAFAFGVIALDEGDAPVSYGTAAHVITPGLDKQTVQPFIGSQEADIDEKDLDTTLPDWTRDDQTGEPADEGAVQLMGQYVKKNENYTLHHANDKTYELDILADPQGNSASYVRAWVDFNNDGKFTDDEASEMEEVTAAGKLTVKFTHVPQNVDPSVEKLGMRVRTAVKKADVEKPTGFAFSGEVEDFQIQQTVPPRGSKLETTDSQGKTQSGDITFTSHAQTDYETTNTAIDTSVKPVMLTKDGVEVKDSDLDADGYYVVKGQGKYKITSDASAKDVSVEFVPEPTFVGKADGISVRRVDTNGKSTGWGRNGNAIVGGEFVPTSPALDTMDGSFIPEVTPVGAHGKDAQSKDMQGAPQYGTVEFAPDTDDPQVKARFTPSDTYPAKLVDPETKELKDQLDAKDATGKTVGTYTIEPTTGKVTFQPVPTFTGKPLEVTVQLTAPVGQDKDGTPSLATATATYQPDVKGTTFTIDPAVSDDKQGAVQTGTPKITAENELGDVGKLTYSLVDPATDTLTTDPVTVDDEGTYTINPDTGEVTFTPVASYVGTHSIFVRATTSTGVVSEKAEYKATVTPLEVTSEPATSEGQKGEKQSGIPKFTPPQAPKDTTISATPLYAFEDGTTEKVVDKQGTFTLDAKTGDVTFQPVAEFVGTADPVTVKATYTLTAVDKTTAPLTATTTYTPKVLLPLVKGSEAKTSDIQGRKQEATVTFTTEDGTRIAPSAQYPAKLVDPRTGDVTEELTVDALDGERKVGTYTIEPSTGHVIFQPDVTYAGTPKPASVSLTAKVGEDKDGQPVLAAEARGTYAPDVIPVTITPNDVDSTTPQGSARTRRPQFVITSPAGRISLEKYELVRPDGSTTTDPVAIDGAGTFSIDTAGRVTFQPVAGFVGTSAIAVRASTADGVSADATYTAAVEKVESSSMPSTSEKPKGEVQKGTPKFTAPDVEDDVTLSKPRFAFVRADGSGDSAPEVGTELTVPGQGAYALNATTGEVTFTPEAEFVGVADPVSVRATYTLTAADGTTADVTRDDTHTSTVVAPGVSARGDTSRGLQGAVQKGKVTFTHTPSGQAVADGSPEGTDGDGAGLVRRFLDPQTGEPTDALSIPARGTLDGVADSTVGTYALDARTGEVTFTPLASFTGKPEPARVTLTLQVGVDKTGTGVSVTASATYAPEVIPVTLTHTDKQTTGVQGTVQKGTPEFGAVDGDGKDVGFTRYALLDPATGTEATAPVTLDGVGTYRIDAATGEVTFTPVAAYVTDDAHATQVTVRAFTETGLSEDAVYAPRVTPLMASGVATASSGPQGASQIGDPWFSAPSVPDGLTLSRPIFAFADGSVRMSVSGEGVYELDPATGKVTFTPELRFMGRAKGVTVHAMYTLTGADGSTAVIEASAAYVPSVYIITRFVDENGWTLVDHEKGAVPAKDIPGYILKATTHDEYGNIIHHYAKVVAVIPTNTRAKKLSKTGTAVLSILAVAALAVVGGAASLLLRKRSEK